MSVLIKSMEMPTSCYECPCNKDDGFGFFTCGVTKSECDFRNLPSDCPLIEVPPHGRLIDADALMKDGWYLHKQVMGMSGCATHELPLNNPSIPTIIEAEEEEHGRD